MSNVTPEASPRLEYAISHCPPRLSPNNSKASNRSAVASRLTDRRALKDLTTAGLKLNPVTSAFVAPATALNEVRSISPLLLVNEQERKNLKPNCHHH